MSSRKGNVITAQWLLDEAHARAAAKIKEAKHDEGLSPEEIDTVAEQVAIGAMKYAFLKVGIGKDLEFSFDQSISFEGNSGPYLQYTYVRTQSILAKGKELSAKGENGPTLSSLLSALSEQDVILLRRLYQFADVVDQAAQDLAPSHIATYLFDLAQEFNNYYQKVRILPGARVKGEGESTQETNARLMLTASVGVIIKQGLGLLGIEAPQKM